MERKAKPIVANPKENYCRQSQKVEVKHKYLLTALMVETDMSAKDRVDNTKSKRQVESRPSSRPSLAFSTWIFENYFLPNVAPAWVDPRLPIYFPYRNFGLKDAFGHASY